MHITQQPAERHTLAVVVDNEPGILARIAGLFTARGYNIESLTVCEITEDRVGQPDHDRHQRFAAR